MNLLTYYGLHFMFKLIVILIAYESVKWAIRKLFDKIVNNF